MFSKQDTDLVKCANCGDKERNQKLLQCLHACCEQCVKQAEGPDIVCQQCSTITSTKPFQQNILQEPFRAHVKLTEPRVCFICKEDNKSTLGTHVCFECDSGQLCDGCIKKHRKFPISKTHHPVSLASLARGGELAKHLRREKLCPEHCSANKPHQLSLFCKVCGIAACQLCVITNHWKGEHDIVTTEEIARNAADRIRHETSALREEQQTTLTRLEGIRGALEKLKNDKEYLRNEVRGRMSLLRHSMHEALDRIGIHHINQLEQYFSSMGRAVQRKLKRKEDLLKEVDHVLTLGAAISDTCSYSEMREISGVLFERLRIKKVDLACTNIPTSEPSISINRPERMLTDQVMQSLIGCFSSPDPVCIRPIERMMRNHEEGKQEVKLELLWTVKSKLHSLIGGMDFTTAGTIVMGGMSNKETGPFALEQYTMDGKRMPDIKHNIYSAYQVIVDNDDIYIGDLCRGQVLKINTQGSVSGVIVPPIKLRGGICIGVTRDSVLMASPASFWIYSCNKDQYFVERWSAPEVKLVNPCCLCVTPVGDVVVARLGFNTLSVLDPHCKVKHANWTTGSDSRRSICADNEGRIYIADARTQRVSVISPSGKHLTDLITKSSHDIIGRPLWVKISPRGDMIAVIHDMNSLSLFKVCE